MHDIKVIRIAVSTEADKAISDFAQANDMTKLGVASRLYEWFGRQDEGLQRMLLGMYGDLTPDIAKLVLERTAWPDKKSTTSRKR
ncbi:MAG: hypothetical protein L0Y44_02980 [Phycisphaerales bacterium]|nr:hypothetical protein [Phycisphaerales bacterium]